MEADSRALLPLMMMPANRWEASIAKVLSEPQAALLHYGRTFDAMKDAGGDILLATNDEAMAASALFEQLEGVDIHPASAVAVATLCRS